MATTEIIQNNHIATGAIADGTQSLQHDAYDVQEFDRAIETYQRLAAAVSGSGRELHTAPALIRDLFWSFHKRAPRINENLALKPAFAVNRRILEEIMGTAEWRQLREAGSINDPMISAIATIGACERAIDALDHGSRNRVNRLAAANEAAEKLFGQADVLDELASQATAQQVEDLRKRAAKSRADARRKERAAAELEESLDTDDDERDRSIRLAARRGMAEALDEAEAVQNAIAAFGGGYSTSDGGSGTSREMTTQEKIELAMRVMRSPRLKLIAEMCGRFTRIAMSIQKSRVNHPPSEITSVTIGNDLAHLLPSEVALLGDPDLEDLFYLKFAERRLLQYELEGRESEGRGPIILAMDESGSMSETLGGVVKEAWGKSVMLGLLAIARRQKRDLAVIHFSGPNQLRTSAFPKGESSPLDLIDEVEFFFGGGTVFDRWMEEAARLVDQDRFDRADVIVVSDGIAFISERAVAEWWRRRAERKMRCYGVLIGTDQGVKTLGRISDAVMTLDDLRQDLDVLETNPDETKRTLIRVINRAGSDHIVFALVMEDVDYRALGLNYATDLRIQLHKKTGQMICTTQTTGRIESYHESQQVAAELQPYWREFKDLHVACDLSDMTRRIIDSLQATALRRAGGVYFVPKGKRDGLVRLREMVAGLPHLEDRPFVCAFGVPDLHETKAQMTQALHAGMLDEVAGLRADLRRLIAEGTNVREDTVITRLAAFQGVRAKAQVYADLLGLRLDRMRAEIGELETQARRLLLHDARPAGTNGKQSADLPIIQDTPDIVIVGDEMERLPLSHAAD